MKTTIMLDDEFVREAFALTGTRTKREPDCAQAPARSRAFPGSRASWERGLPARGRPKARRGPRGQGCPRSQECGGPSLSLVRIQERELVRLALQELIRRCRKRDLTELAGRIRLRDAFDHKVLRHARDGFG